MLSAVHVSIKRMLSKFQTYVSWNSRSRRQDVKKFGTRAGIRSFELQCSHNFKINAAKTTGKQEAKLFKSNAQHLLIYIKCPGRGGGGVLNKVLYGEAPHRGPNPYPFMYHF